LVSIADAEVDVGRLVAVDEVEGTGTRGGVVRWTGVGGTGFEGRGCTAGVLRSVRAYGLPLRNANSSASRCAMRSSAGLDMSDT
jgi:hypothetical protein